MTNFLLKYYPTFTTFILIYIIWSFNNDVINVIDFNNLINSTMVVFSVLLGFLLTVITLLHTIDNSVMRAIKSTDKFDLLVYYLKSAIFSSLIVALLSLMIPIIKSLITNFNGYDLIILEKYFFLYLILVSVTLTIRFIYVFIKIII